METTDKNFHPGKTSGQLHGGREDLKTRGEVSLAEQVNVFTQTAG